jgi:hypothetical protein
MLHYRAGFEPVQKSLNKENGSSVQDKSSLFFPYVGSGMFMYIETRLDCCVHRSNIHSYTLTPQDKDNLAPFSYE